MLVVVDMIYVNADCADVLMLEVKWRLRAVHGVLDCGTTLLCVSVAIAGPATTGIRHFNEFWCMYQYGL